MLCQQAHIVRHSFEHLRRHPAHLAVGILVSRVNAACDELDVLFQLFKVNGVQERAVRDECYRHLKAVEVSYEFHKVGSASGLASLYYGPNATLRDLVKYRLPLVSCEIAGANELHLGLLVGIAEGTHRAVKVAIVRHAKHCNDWPPPPNRPVGSPLAQELDGPYRVDHAASLQGPLF